jgi:hypothetical protein
MTKATIIAGFSCAVLVLILIIFRKRRLDVDHFGICLGAYLSGSNFPAAIFLAMYVFENDPLFQQTKLKGYEKQIALAGLALFLSALIGVWKLCKTAWER